MLNHSGMSHDVAERCDIERVKQLSYRHIVKNLLLKGGKFVSDGL